MGSATKGVPAGAGGLGVDVNFCPATVVGAIVKVKLLVICALPILALPRLTQQGCQLVCLVFCQDITTKRTISVLKMTLTNI